MLRQYAIFVFLIAVTGRAQVISRAYAGPEKKAHLVFANGAKKVMPAEKQQVGVENFVIAPDQHAVGWAVLIDNCCTSYPVPVTLVIFRNGRKIKFSSGQMIRKWHFLRNSERVAVLWAPTHSWAGQACLYDVRSGKQLANWWGRGDPPDWAAEWEDQFEH